MPYYNSVEALLSAAQSRTASILKKDVKPAAEKILTAHIKSDIYDAYSPKDGAWVNGSTYDRRNSLYNVKSKITDNVLFVTSDASPSKPIVKGYSIKNDGSGSFLKMLEVGNMGIWRSGFSRPAVSNAQREVESSGEIKAAIKNGIKREFG